ncbi:hypothetical protein [Kluyvera sichuanensis]|uniref:hypothetical protein n=1 Tax=Kluyvera sichuanensis TaxID=2725494 RepID=UPI0039F479CA
MPLHRRNDNVAQVVSGEKELLQSLATNVATGVAISGAAVMMLKSGFEDRQKRSSATLLRRKLVQTTLERELQEI